MTRASTARSTDETSTHARAQDGKRGAFALKTPKRIAARLKDLAEHTDRSHDPYRSAMSMLTGRINRGAAQLPTEEKERLEKAKEELRTLFQRPSTGRTSALGRRVEKPGTGRQSGPSGQTDGTKHDRKHTNK
jgi:hypothetical protein